MADNFKFFQGITYSLAGAGAVAGDTSVTLKSMTDADGVALTMSGTFGTKGFGTLEPGNGSNKEQISFTGLVNNSNGTVTLTGVKSVTFAYPYTETSGLLKTHAGSTSFVISNTSGFYDELTSKDDDETINGTWSFTQVPNTSQDPVTGDDLARRSWVLSVVNGGPVSTDKVIVNGTAGETLVAGNLIYLKSADNRWWKTDGATASTVENVPLGIAQGAGTAGNPVSGGILINGIDDNQSGLVASTIYYASNTPGAISSTPGTKEVTIGISLSVTELAFFPRYNQQITEDEQDAMSGGGAFGTPSATNKFATEDYIQIPSSLALSAFQQNLFEDTAANTAGRQAFGSSQDGSVLYYYSSQSGILTRWSRDSITGMYVVTHSVNPSIDIPSGDNGSIIQIGTFIYFFSNDNTNIICSRFLAADLTGEQAMTVPTVACTTDVIAWTDGTDAYVISYQSNTTSRKWTLSGTTFSATTTAVVSGINGNAFFSTMWDGTNAFVILNDSPILIYKLTAIDGSAKTTTTIKNYVVDDIAARQSVNLIANIDTTRIYIGAASYYTTTTEMLSLRPISKP